jgi:phytoene dehydrogenase-like protein
VAKAIAAVRPEDIPKYDAISVIDWIRGITSDPEIIYFVSFFSSVMLTHADPNNMSTGAYLRLMRTPIYDPTGGGLLTYYLKGGMGSGMKILEQVCEENGVVIKRSCDVTKLIIENDEIKGVLAEEGNRSRQIRWHRYGEVGKVQRYDASVVVTSFPIWNLFEIASQKQFPNWFVEWFKGFQGKTTAILGFWIISREPILKENWFVLTESPRTKLPFVVLPLTNLVHDLAPEGLHFTNQVSLCELDIKEDRVQIYDCIELLKEDMDEFYPGWRQKVTGFRPYFFDFEKPSHMPTRFGIFRPGPKAPKVQGLYFTGETVNTDLPTTDGTAESAMICAKEILGTDQL